MEIASVVTAVRMTQLSLQAGLALENLVSVPVLEVLLVLQAYAVRDVLKDTTVILRQARARSVLSDATSVQMTPFRRAVVMGSATLTLVIMAMLTTVMAALSSVKLRQGGSVQMLLEQRSAHVHLDIMIMMDLVLRLVLLLDITPINLQISVKTVIQDALTVQDQC